MNATNATRSVYLHGSLSEGIGERIQLAFESPVRALRLLELNFPGFLKRFEKGWFRVVLVQPDGSERPLREETLDMHQPGDLVITPVLSVAQNKRKGMLGIILGAVLVGAAFFFSGGALGTALPGMLGGSLGLTYQTIAQVGVALALQGISTLLSPTPPTDAEREERQSFVFNGPRNLTQPGAPVPLVYGRMMVGTHTVSAALDVEMLLGTITPSAVRAAYPITFAYEDVTIDAQELVRSAPGARITEINSVAVTDEGAYVVGNITLTFYDGDVHTEEEGEDYLVVSYTGTQDGETSETIEVPIELTYNSNPLTSTLTIEVGLT